MFTRRIFVVAAAGLSLGACTRHVYKMRRRATEAQVTALGFFPDGAAGGPAVVVVTPAEVLIFDATTGAPRAALRASGDGRDGPIFDGAGRVALAGAGRIALHGADGGRAGALGVDDGAARAPLGFAGPWALAKAFPRGAGSAREARLEVYDATGSRVAGHPAGKNVGRAAVSPDARFAVCHVVGQGLCLWRAAEPLAPPRLLVPGQGGLGGQVFSDDGALFATGAGGWVKVFETEDWREVAALATERSGGRPTGFVGHDLLVDDGGFDQVRVSVAGDERWRLRATAERGRRYAVGWLRGARKLVVYTEKPGSLLVVDAESGAVEGVLADEGEYGWQRLVQLLAVSDDGRRVMVEHAGRVHLWDVAARALVECVDPRAPEL